MTSLKTPIDESKHFEKPMPGMHLARCYRIIDLGTHTTEYQNKHHDQHKVLIGFELPNDLLTEGDKVGEPMVLSKRYTLSHSEKANLRKDLESWYGRKFSTDQLNQAGGFDLAKVLGREAMINVSHSEDGKYANIEAVTPLMAGMTCPSPVNPPVIFSLAEFNQAVFDSLSDKLKDTIMQSKEWGHMFGGVPTPEQGGHDERNPPADFDDDIPFD